MQTTALRLYSLSYTEGKTYLLTFLFVVGNIIFPQLAHLIPQGGYILLPIYFFTLIAAYKYGWRAGVMTAILSPIVNHLLFGMPPLVVLPLLLTKSLFLAISASLAAHYFKGISVAILSLVVVLYQLSGTVVEWAIVGDFMVAIQDFRIGIPGMLLQIFGGYCMINYLLRH